MGNDRLSNFVWPKPEELRQIALQRTLTSDELLALKSRSFYFPIQLLELARGRDEANKRTIVTALYNILREQDTIEDANPQILTSNAKMTLLDHFNRIMNTLVRRSPSEPIGDILEDLSEFTDILVQGVMDVDEKIFVQHFGEGRVLEDVRAHATQNVKEAIGFCDSSMTMGMKAFLKSGKISTKDKLVEYCGYVAGDVGIALNRIVNHVDGVKLGDVSARAFGVSLQLTNVIKNINEDWVRRGVLYVPEEFYSGIENRTLFDMGSKEGRAARKSILENLVLEARKNFGSSADYIGSIPPGLSGYAGFCMVPFLAALETLNTVERAGAEEVFSGKEGATKMSAEAFMNIMRFTDNLLDERGERVGNFMHDYKTAQEEGKPEKYSFEPKKFEKWAKEFIKE